MRVEKAKAAAEELERMFADASRDLVREVAQDQQQTVRGSMEGGAGGKPGVWEGVLGEACAAVDGKRH